ncbi:MAG: pyridoxine 5'-phosphate synthase [Acidobacteria bacterium]|nr:pyridoxine 5'-phosphate synthase [Acidobacteriota bacterium]MCA1642928.1 pyridoxine 5'-phosphate synthase [Acidobacteriota bacterium]
MTARLNVNIDHVATVRQARRAPEPSVAAAAALCEQAGADGITVHLRADRRHIQDADVFTLRRTVTTYLNLEMSVADEMISVALEARPDAVTLVPENPNEITTEGGLDVRANSKAVRAAIDRLRECDLFASVFIDPDAEQVAAARDAGAQQVELCTALYAEATLGARGVHGEGAGRAAAELKRLHEAARLAAQSGLKVAAGHGLTYRNVGALAAAREIEEFNIGHNLIARAVLVGLDPAVREMREAIRRGRAGG